MVEAQGIQRQRMNTILRAVLETPRATRGALSERMGLSPSSIVKYAKALIDKGLIRETDREELLDIKAGRWPLAKIKQYAEQLFQEVKQARDASPLPPEPESVEAERLLIRIVEWEMLP